MADSTLPMGGTGTVKTQVTAANSHVQVVRDQPATTAVAPVSWSATAAGTANVIAANADRTVLTLISQATGTLFIRFDGTIPTSALYHWYLAAGERWEVPNKWARLAVSLAGSVDGGFVLLGQGTDA